MSYYFEIWNKNKIKLNINDLYIKYFQKPKDVTVIEIQDLYDIYQDIEFLDYDINYKQNGYLIYQDVDVFSVYHPLGDSASCANGKIKSIKGYEFNHNIPTEFGSSGCPIIILYNNLDLIQVIGIHKKGNNKMGINCGTFIGEIINEINEEINNNVLDENIIEDFKEIKENKMIKAEKENYITAELYVNMMGLFHHIDILNSSEFYKYTNFDELEEKECEIMINDQLIKFNSHDYFVKFKIMGTYKIKYKFKYYLTKTNYMFSGCKYLINIDLSNFNTKNVTNMNNMFSDCSY